MKKLNRERERSQIMSDKIHDQKGNSPEQKVRSQRRILSRKNEKNIEKSKFKLRSS